MVRDRSALTDELTGAPETYRCHRDSQSVPLQITTAVDIWSLGCVFSEAAVWVHDGWSRVKEYRRQRSLEIERETKGGTKGEQIFHWDNRILDTVQKAHQNMLGKTSTSHWVVRELVGQVIHDMLQYGPRPHADFVFNKAKRIINERADHFQFCLVRPNWSIDADNAGAAELKNSTMDPPQLPPDITPDSSIWSGERGRSTLANTRTTLSDAVVSSDDPPLSPTSSMQSVGNYASARLSRENNPMGATIPTSTQPRLTTPAHDPSSNATASGYAHGRVQQRSYREQSGRPSLSIEEGQSWKERKKRGEHLELPGSENLASLNERDHVSRPAFRGTPSM